MKTRTKVMITAALTVLMASQTASASWDIVTHLNRFTGGGGGNLCEDAQLYRSDDYKNAMLTAKSKWDYDRFIYWSDANVDTHDFADFRTQSAWGRDSVCPYDTSDHSCTNGTDWADVVYLITHGRSTCEGTPWNAADRWDVGQCGTNTDIQNAYGWTCSDTANGARTYFRMGDATPDISGYPTAPVHNGQSFYTCNIDTRDGISLGYGTDAFLTTACSSLDPCTWANGGYDDMTYSHGQFSTYLGFYGQHNWHGGTPNDKQHLEQYVAATKDNGIGVQWLEKMYDNRTSSSGTKMDNCPVVLVYGSSKWNMNFQYQYGGFRDFKNTGTKNMSRIYFLGGCDPNGAIRPPLPTFGLPVNSKNYQTKTL